MRTKHSKQTKHPQLLYYLLVVYVLLAPCGCRSTQDNQIDLLERELRSQEDYIYELEDYVVEYSEKLRECRCTRPHEKIVYSSPKKEKSITKRKSTSSNHVKRQTSEPETIEPDADDLPVPEDVEIEMEPVEELDTTPEPINLEELEAPELDISDPLSQADDVYGPKTEFEAEVDVFEAEFQEVEAASYEVEADYEDDSFQEETYDEPLYEQVDYQEEQSQEGSQLVYIPDPSQFSDESEVVSEEDPEVTDGVELVTRDEHSIVKERDAERIVVTQLFRGSGKVELPKTLLTVVEARDAYDEPADFEGEVSLMLMTAETEAPQRIHRWDFTKEETQMAWQSSELGDGLHLELPLEETKLPKEAVELWVRLVMADGRKLLTQLPFEKRELLAIEEAASTEEALAEAKPLSEAEEADSAEAELVVQAEPQTNVLRSSSKEPKKTDKPRWRASMQSTQSVATKNFSTSSPGTMRWKAQPAGGRTPYQPSIATRPRPIEKASSNSPQWQPYR